MKKVILFLLIMLLPLLLQATTSQDSPLQKVSLQFQWKHQFEFAGFYAAKEKGYYKDSGLDVDFYEYVPGIDMIDEVVSGKKSFGIWASSLIKERLSGKPVVMLANYFKRSPLAIVTTPEIRLPSDLKGKKLMISPKDVGSANFLQMWRAFGIDPKRDINLLSHSFDIRDLIQGKVDAASVFLTNELYMLQQARFAYNILDPNNYGTELYDVNLFTSETLRQSKPTLVRDFTEASKRGWEYALSHPDEIVELILKKYNTQHKSKEALLYEARETAKIMLPNVYPVGSIDGNKVRRISELFVQMGEAKSLENLEGFTHQTQSVKAEHIALTQEERYWLSKNPKASIALISDYTPFAYKENGVFKGFDNDLLEILSQKTGLKFEKQIDFWPENLDKFKKGEVDLIADISYKKERESFTLYTTPYYEVPTVVFVRDDFSEYAGLESLRGKRVGIQKSIFYAKELKKFAGLDLVEFTRYEEMTKALAYGKIDAVIQSLSVINYFIRKNNLTNIKIADEFNFGSVGREDLRFGVNTDKPLLRTILQKGLDAISEKEWAELTNHWIGAKLETKTGPKLPLTKEEQAWLEAHPVIKATNDPAYPPFDFHTNGKATGFTVDLIEKLAKIIEVKLEWVLYPDWEKAKKDLLAGKVQLVHDVSKSLEREKIWAFTQPYMTNYTAIYATPEMPVKSITDFRDKTIAMPSGYQDTESLRARYPEVTIKEYIHPLDCLKAVNFKEADATIVDSAVANYLIAQNGLNNIVLKGISDLQKENPDANNFYMATSRDNAPLVSILDKALSAIDPAILAGLKRKWFIADTTEKAQRIVLTKEEQVFINQNPVVRVSAMNENPPFSFKQNNTYAGYDHALLQMLSERTGLRFEIVGGTWTNVLGKFKDAKTQMIADISYRAEREEFARFTEPYFELPIMVYGTEAFDRYNNLDSLRGKKIGVARSSFIVPGLQKIPGATVVEYDGYKNYFRALSEGKIDVAVTSMIYGFRMDNFSYPGVRILGEIELEGIKKEDLRFGVRKELPELHSILQKAMDSITYAEWIKLQDSWIIVSDTLNTSKPTIPLTRKEQLWLQNHPILKVSNELDWPPFDFAIGGEPQGYSIDLLNLLAQKTGIKIEYVNGYSWARLQEMLKEGKLDLVHSAARTKERESYALFGHPYYRYKNYFIVHADHPDIESFEDLKDKKIAVVKGSFQEQFLKENLPDLKTLVVDNYDSLYESISNKQADATFENRDGVRYFIRKKGLRDIRISGWAKEYDESQNFSLYYMAQKSDPELISILNKALAFVSINELDELSRKWFGESDREHTTVTLSKEEQRWLMANPKATIAMLKDVPPFSSVENGQPRGMEHDLLKLLSERTGLHFEPRFDSWSHNFEAFKSKQTDLIAQISYKKERESFTKFTVPYYEVPNVIYVRDDFGEYQGLESLKSKKVAILKDIYFEKELREFGGITIVEYNTIEEVTRALVYGKVDALIQAISSVGHQIRKNAYTNLRLVDELKLPGIQKEDFRFGVNPDKPLLHSIIQKGLAAITEQERFDLISKWVGASSFESRKMQVQLTREEKKFLQAHPVVKVHMEEGYPPYSFQREGEFTGYSIEFSDLIAQSLGITFEYSENESWSDAVEKLKNRKIDIIAQMINNEERRQYASFTDHYMRHFQGILTRVQHSDWNTLDKLKGKKVGVVQGYVAEKALRENYPEITVIPLPDNDQLINEVINGSIDAGISTHQILQYGIMNRFLTNLAIHPILGNPHIPEVGEGFAVRKDWPLLHSAMQKAMRAFPQESKRALQAKWLGETKEKKPTISLSREEQAWLASMRSSPRSKPTIKVSNEMDYPPYDFAVGGQPQGYSIDLLNLLSERIGLRMEYVNGYNWNQLIDQFKQKKLDLIHTAAKTPVRESYALFSDPYYRYKTIFVTRRGEAQINDIRQLYGKVVAIGKGYAIEEYLALHHPKIRLLAVEGLQAMLESVASGDAYATLENEGSLRYFIRRFGYSGLATNGVFYEFDTARDNRYHFFAQKDAPELISMLNKALASLAPGELEELEHKWFGNEKDTKIKENLITLTDDEKQWIADHPVFRYSESPWEPLVFVKDKQFSGIIREYVNEIASKTGLTLEFHYAETWPDVLKQYEAGELDFVPAAISRDMESDNNYFSIPYLAFPLVVASKQDIGFISSLSQLQGKKVGVGNGYSSMRVMQQNYPELALLPVLDTRAGINALASGQIDVFVGLGPVVTHWIRQQGVESIKVAGISSEKLSMSFCSKDPVFIGIANKVFASMDQKDISEINQKYIGVQFEQNIDYGLIWKILAGVSVLLIGFYLWNRKLAKLNKQIKIKNSLIEQRSAEVERISHQVSTLLNNSEQGFLSFSDSLRVDKGYSRECERIFDGAVLNQPIDQLLAPDDKKLQGLIQKGIQMVFASHDDELRREAFMSLIPEEYQLYERFFKAEYRLLEANLMMLILTDITDEKKLQEKVEREKKRLEFVVEAMENRTDLLEILEEYHTFRSHTLPSLLSKTGEAESVLIELYRHIHTFKGLFAQSSLPEIPKELHALEDKLGRLRDGGDSFDINDIKLIFAQFDLSGPLEKDLDLLREKIGENYFTEDREVCIPLPVVDRLEQDAIDLLTREEGHILFDAKNLRILYGIRRLRYVSLESLLSPHFKASEQLAERLEKEIHPIVYQGDKAMIDPYMLGGFCRALVHLFRNAVDHGIEDPDERAETDKDEVATIGCEVKTSEEQLTLTIWDDGKGIDVAIIKKKALEKGVIGLKEAELLLEQDALQLIFRDGFSTRDEVSAISGRGVGLGALYEELGKADGKIEIESQIGEGTKFVFTLPYQADGYEGDKLSEELEKAQMILLPLKTVTQEYFKKEFGMAIQMDEEIVEVAHEMVCTHNAQVEYESLGVVMGLSISCQIVEACTRTIHDDCSEEEMQELLHDVGDEIANVLFGRATIYYSHIDKRVRMGAPIELSSEDVVQMLDKQMMYGLKGHWKEYGFTIYYRKKEG